MSFVGLPSFCERVTRESDADGPQCYLRIRVGEKRRTAQLAASRIQATGADPVELAAELAGRIDNIGYEAVWIEAMHKGVTNPIDSFRIPRRNDEPATVGPLETALHCMVSMSRASDERAASAEYRCQQSHDRMMDLVEAVWSERLKMAEMEKSGGGISEALALAGPALATVAARLAAPRQITAEVGVQEEQSEGQSTEEETDRAVDACIEFLARATEENPDLITPERIAAMTPVVSAAMKF